MSLVQNCAVGHGVVIPSGQAMFKPGLDGLSYGVGAVFGGKAVTLVSTQREQPLLRLCLGLLAHPPPLPLARGAKSDIDGRACTNTTVGGLAVPVGSDMSAHSFPWESTAAASGLTSMGTAKARRSTQ